MGWTVRLQPFIDFGRQTRMAAPPPESDKAARAGSASAPLSRTVTDRVRKAILTGELLPGARLHLEEMRSEFGVSLSPLREGLSRLAAEGLVLVEDQRGYSVAPVSRRNFNEILDLRTMLETKALRAAIERGDDAWEGEIIATQHLLSKFETQRWEEPYVEPWEQKHRAFHDALLKACDSPLLLSFCQLLHDMNHRYRRIFLLKKPPSRDVAKEHRDIMKASLARDADKAAKLLRDHIQVTGRNILRQMPG
jgi:GntR family carbon starvation induced transcriptional regulator